MSADKYLSIFSRHMEAIVYIYGNLTLYGKRMPQVSLSERKNVLRNFSAHILSRAHVN